MSRATFALSRTAPPENFKKKRSGRQCTTAMSVLPTAGKQMGEYIQSSHLTLSKKANKHTCLNVQQLHSQCFISIYSDFFLLHQNLMGISNKAIMILLESLKLLLLQRCTTSKDEQRFYRALP